MIIIWSPKSRSDLRSIQNYIAEYDPAAAQRVVLSIVDLVENQLSAMPRLGRKGRAGGTFELVLSRLPYIVVYRLRDRDIDIVRVYHTSRLWPETF
jgi:toxin ParE1/3/4